ncbi:MAG: ornithine carbamoyltransferase [Verrucomicrobia bacterium]|nr:ornithine carbamoyltransferase [Verrucomicrobiota bacterium]
MKHLLSIEHAAPADLRQMIADAATWKRERGRHPRQPLAGQSWAMIFNKASTRTRVSFEVGIRELGGSVMFLSAAEIQLGRGEPIKDTARVLGRMVHGAIMRTYRQADVEEFARFSGIPTINALTDDEHPCQILADLFTFEERRGPIQDRVVTFVGDAACNVATSWIFAAAKLGFELRLAAPRAFQPAPELLARAGGRVRCTEDAHAAADGADLLYTDVWVSMGKEAEAAERLRALAPYQVNAALVKRARPGALVMHCLPAYRGKEIDEATFEANADTIFTQAENRLHVQKAILAWIVS